MLHTTCASAITLILGLSLATGLQAASLQETVRETVKTNPEVLIANSERNTVEQQMEQARAGFFPQADITVGYIFGL